jgi:molybdopterin converting factor small subunit
MTPEVTIEIAPWISQALGKKSKVTMTEQIRKDESLKSLLERIAEKHDGFGAMIYCIPRGTIDDAVVIFVNNRPVLPDLNVKIKGGDTIVVTPFYSGG